MILKFQSKSHLVKLNMLEEYAHGVAKHGCRPQQTFLTVDTKDNFFQIFPFVLSFQAFGFRAKVL